MLALTMSTQVIAYEQDDSPSFDSLVCVAGNLSVQIKIQLYRQTYGAGPAAISSNGVSWGGGWQWQAAKQGTRLMGHHHLTVNANSQNGLGSFSLHTLYTPYGQMSGGWLEMPGYSGAVNCQIAAKPHMTHECKASPQNDCSVSPKRLCCDCENGQLSCY